MQSNLKMTQSKKAQKLALSLLSNSSVESHNCSQPNLNLGESETHLNRELAWQVAPNLLVSFQYAWRGVRYAFVTQRNFRIHTGIGIVAVSLGVVLKVTAVEMSVVALTCGLVLVLELLNTAIESVVDLTVGHSYHELAKIAKDCAAGAVLISAIAALLVASFVLFPPLFIFLKTSLAVI